MVKKTKKKKAVAKKSVPLHKAEDLKKPAVVKTLVLAPNEAVELIPPPGHVLGMVPDLPKRALVAAPVPVKKKRGWFMRLFTE